MTFLWPEVLWFLALVPLLVAAYLFVLARRKRAAARFAALSLVKEAIGKRGSVRRHLPPILFLTALAVMIVAAARPAAEVTLPSERGTIILAIDVSGSMRATDVKPSRIQAAKEAARLFVQQQPHNVRIGVVAFSGFANIVQAPTLNRNDVLASIDRLFPQRATAIGSGILVSLSALFPELQFDLGPQRPRFGLGDPYGGGTGFGGGQGGGFGGYGGYGGFGQGGGGLGSPGASPGSSGTSDQLGTPKQPLPPPVPPGSDRSAAIILLTDGQSNTGMNPIDAAQTAADLGVRVYTVGLGTTTGQILGFGGWRAHVQLDEQTLKRIATLTVGKYFRAESDTDLKQVYRDLSTRLISERQKSEISALFTAAAAALALVAALLSLLWFGRLM